MQPAPTVFVIDDDPAVLKSLRWLVESAGLAVETYASAQTFLKAFDRNRPGCVVADVRMPSMSGLELQRKLRTRRATIPIIVITGHADVPTAVQAMKAGAFDFIEKPLSGERVLDRIQQAVAQDVRSYRPSKQRAETRLRLAQLTARERQVLDLVVAGKTTNAIAAELGLKSRTVQVYRARLNEKMGARNVADLVRIVQVGHKQIP